MKKTNILVENDKPSESFTFRDSSGTDLKKYFPPFLFIIIVIFPVYLHYSQVPWRCSSLLTSSPFSLSFFFFLSFYFNADLDSFNWHGFSLALSIAPLRVGLGGFSSVLMRDLKTTMVAHSIYKPSVPQAQKISSWLCTAKSGRRAASCKVIPTAANRKRRAVDRKRNLFGRLQPDARSRIALISWRLPPSLLPTCRATSSQFSVYCPSPRSRNKRVDGT